MLGKPTILVIFGITGDLAKKKLEPALLELGKAGKLPEKFQLVGVTRQGNVPSTFQMNLDDFFEYERLGEHLDKLEMDMGPAQRLFYLALPPKTVEGIIKFLGESGLASNPNTKLLLEKPFGLDLKSAEETINFINKLFSPDQVYRIDHYLAKNMAQEIAKLRESLSNENVERIEIVAKENIGVESRANFYEQTGALRDVVQSHLLELTATLLSQDRLEALKKLRVLGTPKRGQYKGYKEEVGNENSQVETFASLDLESEDPHWQGVPISLVTGKKLDKKLTEIRIFYKNGESTVFKDSYEKPNQAYEQVFLNAMVSDQSLFITSDEVLETWRILTPVQESWNTMDDLIIYEPGSTMENKAVS